MMNKLCIDYLEKVRWKDGVVSPFDPTSKVYKCKSNRYKCKNSNKYFNVRTGTIFECSNIKLRTWFLAAYYLISDKKGVSSYQLARDINVTQATAWFMMHRIRKCFKQNKDVKLTNEVEIDETFVGGKNKNRHRDKKVKNSQGRSYKDKTPVIGMIERKGLLIAKVIKNTQGKTLMRQLLKYVDKDALVITDEWKGYKNVYMYYEHKFVNHGAKQYADGSITTNTIEGFWGIFKRGIIGVYNRASRKHLQRYVDEFVFRYNYRKLPLHETFGNMMKQTTERLRYKDLVA